MTDLLNRSHDSARAEPSENGGATSAPERELLNFIDSVAMLIGQGPTRILTDIWLDELACMECAPDMNEKNWRTVSLAASTRLARELIALQLRDP